ALHHRHRRSRRNLPDRGRRAVQVAQLHRLEFCPSLDVVSAQRLLSPDPSPVPVLASRALRRGPHDLDGRSGLSSAPAPGDAPIRQPLVPTLAEELRVSSNREQPPAPPRTLVEQSLVEIWNTTLDRRNVAPTDNFFEIGGDSLLALVTIEQINQRLG